MQYTYQSVQNAKLLFSSLYLFAFCSSSILLLFVLLLFEHALAQEWVLLPLCKACWAWAASRTSPLASNVVLPCFEIPAAGALGFDDLGICPLAFWF